MDLKNIPARGRLEITEVPVDAIPADAFGAIVGKEHPFLLDTGITDYHGLGHHSFMGADPFLKIISRGCESAIECRGKHTTVSGNPFDVLGDVLRRFEVDGDRDDIPFTGGAVGYLSYDLKGHLEKLPDTVEHDQNFPDLCMSFYDEVMVFDHDDGTWRLCKTYFEDEGKGKARLASTERANEWRRIIEGALEAGSSDGRSLMKNEKNEDALEPESNFTREEYLRAVERALEYIRAGDIYQVNLSQRFRSPRYERPWKTYRRLRKLNAAPMSAYLGLNGSALLSSSPERFMKVQGKHVETRPIKGTRPRGKDPDEDRRHIRQLLASEKDRAELNMIVDLERNDLGRVCEYGSIKVTRHAEVESYATVHHLVSTVEGTLREDLDVIDLIKASFPGGSITGAPKIRAMEIIDELEPTARSAYSGSIGYIDFNGDADINIAIRTIMIGPEEVTFQVGGGIVADSTPEEEYIETLHKGKAIFDTLKGAK